MADGGEVLALRHDVAARDGRGEVVGVDGRGGVRELHPLRPLEEQEVLHGVAVEGAQLQVHAGRVVPRRLRQVRPPEVGRPADGGEQVVDERQVEHLLAGDVAEGAAPPLDGGPAVLVEALVGGLLEGEGGVEVLAHDPVFELGRLAQHVDQRFPVLDHERRLGRGAAAPGGEHAGERAAGGRGGIGGRRHGRPSLAG
jgi:hypothetical protein